MNSLEKAECNSPVRKGGELKADNNRGLKGRYYYAAPSALNSDSNCSQPRPYGRGYSMTALWAFEEHLPI